jgi:Tfp pilus assembly protein PilW
MQVSSFHSRRPRISGFSLIEVLVATTVLMIIVMIVAMVFQQSSGAWSNGTRRANAAMSLRSVLGQVQREIVEAVDARDFTNATSEAFANTFVSGSSTGVRADFIALLGDPVGSNRVPFHIRYVYDGAYLVRTSWKMEYTTGWHNDSSNTVTFLNSSQPLSTFKMNVVSNTVDTAGLPLRVDLEARIDNRGPSLMVSGRSAGRDKSFTDTDDDVVASK